MTVRGDPVETIPAAAQRDRVRRALAELTFLQRETILLAYYEGLTYQEVSQLLRLPAGTVETRMREGLVRLSARLRGRP